MIKSIRVSRLRAESTRYRVLMQAKVIYNAEQNESCLKEIIKKKKRNDIERETVTE